MDKEPLVEDQIDAGFKLVRQLLAGGFDVAAAFWARLTVDDGWMPWMLYIASRVVEESGIAIAYEKVADALGYLDDPWLSISEVTVIAAGSSITQAVLDIRKRHPGPMATRSRVSDLGGLEVGGLYIYPPVEGAASYPTPTIRIIGVKKVESGTATKDVEEEVGYVAGFIGEPEFSNKLASLIKAKFGSAQQFAVTYPRIILEET